MCLALIIISEHPQYPLIILSNRDEFYSRESLSANFWSEYPHIYAGRDAVAHGSWLGVNTRGNFALVTNYRDPKQYSRFKLSRGILVSNYLIARNKIDSLEYLKQIIPNAKDFNPFNLLVGNQYEIYYYSNITNQALKLASGVHCISNHLLNTPWYKMERAKTLFNKLSDRIMNCTEPNKIQDLLFSILADKHLAPDSLLPDTGVGKDLEKKLSSIFVNIPEHEYGTRSSSVILFARDHISFAEITYTKGQNGVLKTMNIQLEQ